jgi:hypothetical protein
MMNNTPYCGKFPKDCDHCGKACKQDIPEVVAFFDKAIKCIREVGYQWEIDLVQNRTFDQMTVTKFRDEYTFCCMHSSGLANNTVTKNLELFDAALKRMDTDPFAKLPNKFLREAVREIWSRPSFYFNQILACKTDRERIKVIRSLPRMGGDASGWHLARNLGIDCVKPDRWMWRITTKYGYESPLDLALFIQKHRPEYRIGTVDVIFWRYCILTGGELS